MSDPVRRLRWDSHSADFVEAGAIPNTKTSKANWWDRAYYGPSLEIASHARNALLAVIAIVRNRNKGHAFKFGNVTMKELGFRREDKIRALTGSNRFHKGGMEKSTISLGHRFEKVLTADQDACTVWRTGTVRDYVQICTSSCTTYYLYSLLISLENNSRVWVPHWTSTGSNGEAGLLGRA